MTIKEKHETSALWRTYVITRALFARIHYTGCPEGIKTTRPVNNFVPYQLFSNSYEGYAEGALHHSKL